MDFLEDLFENLFERKKSKGWGGGHHGDSGHHGRKDYPNDKRQLQCPKCGAENNPTSDFCAACGASLSSNMARRKFINCAHCGSQNDLDQAYCKSCGAPLSKTASGACQSCASHLPPDARFCPGCGRAV